MQVIGLNQRFILEVIATRKVADKLKQSITISFEELPALLNGWITLRFEVNIKQAEFIRQLLKHIKHD